MLITIQNLPSTTRYTDIKLLLQTTCYLTEGFVLDNLVSDGSLKKVTVGLAEEGDATAVIRKLNGYFYNGHRLFVEDVRKTKKNPEPPTQASSSKMDTGSNMNNMPVNQPMNPMNQINPMNPMLMSTPFYSMPGQTPYYSMPQTSFMGYGSQQQQTMYQANQMQSPNQGFSQAPLGFRPEGSYSTGLQPWAENQQNNQTNNGLSGNSGSRPEKRSLDDRTGSNYPGYNNKVSRWEESKVGGLPTHGRAQSDEKGWQSRGRDENRSRSSNPNDYGSGNDNRRGFNNLNDEKGSSNWPDDKPYNSVWSNEPRRAYDRPRENNRDPGPSYDKRDNFDRGGYDRRGENQRDPGPSYDKRDDFDRNRNRNNFGQSNERNQKYDRGNDNARNRNQSEVAKPNFNADSAKSFNKYHWPPLKVGPSGDTPARSSGYQGGQNQNAPHGQDPYSNYKAKMMEKSRVNKPPGFQPQKNAVQTGGNSNPNVTSAGRKKYTIPPAKVDSWCGQAAAFVAKEVLCHAGVESGRGSLDTYSLKRMKQLIRSRMENLLKYNETCYQDIIVKYRGTYPALSDKSFYNYFLREMDEKKSLETKTPLEVKRDSVPEDTRPRLEGLRPTPPINETKEKSWSYTTNSGVRVQYIPGCEETWVEGQYDSNYVAIPVTHPVRKPVKQSPKPRTKRALRKAKRMAKQAMKAYKTMNRAQGLPALPSYPKGDKALSKQVKKDQQKMLAGETELPLEPLIAKAVDEELDKLVDILKTEKVASDLYGDVFEMIRLSAIPENFKQAVKIQLSKRLLDMGPVGVRIFGSPKLPKRAELAEFLVRYDVISIKSSQRYPMFIAECSTYTGAAHLLEKVNNTVFNGMTLQLKYLQLVQPQDKMKSRDIQKYRHEFIQKQIDSTPIDLLERGGEPYVFTRKVVPASADQYTGANEDNGEDNQTHVKEEMNESESDKVKLEIVALKKEITNVKAVSNEQVETKPNVVDKNGETTKVEENYENVTTNVDWVDSELNDVSRKFNDTLPEDTTASGVNEAGDDNGDNDESDEEVPDVDLDELDDDDLEDY